jgi:hypothetical protein
MSGSGILETFSDERPPLENHSGVPPPPEYWVEVKGFLNPQRNHEFFYCNIKELDEENDHLDKKMAIYIKRTKPTGNNTIILKGITTDDIINNRLEKNKTKVVVDTSRGINFPEYKNGTYKNQYSGDKYGKFYILIDDYGHEMPFDRIYTYFAESLNEESKKTSWIEFIKDEKNNWINDSKIIETIVNETDLKKINNCINTFNFHYNVSLLLSRLYLENQEYSTSYSLPSQESRDIESGNILGDNSGKILDKWNELKNKKHDRPYWKHKREGVTTWRKPVGNWYKSPEGEKLWKNAETNETLGKGWEPYVSTKNQDEIHFKNIKNNTRKKTSHKIITQGGSNKKSHKRKSKKAGRGKRRTTRKL